jgi:branched-chain amino acid transport system substrate-binding protein
VANPDFSAFVQRAKDANPDAIYIWIPGGAQPAAVGRALAERGIDPAKVKVMGQDSLAFESARKSMGEIALGIITVRRFQHRHAAQS